MLNCIQELLIFKILRKMLKKLSKKVMLSHCDYSLYNIFYLLIYIYIYILYYYIYIYLFIYQNLLKSIEFIFLINLLIIIVKFTELIKLYKI